MPQHSKKYDEAFTAGQAMQNGDATDSEPSSVEDAEAAMQAARADYQLLLYRKRSLESSAKRGRADVSAAILSWQAQFPRITSDELMRQHCREQAAIRAAIADGSMPGPERPVINSSVIDQTAFNSRGARRGIVAGGGDAFRRQVNITRGLRVRPKLPSEL